MNVLTSRSILLASIITLLMLVGCSSSEQIEQTQTRSVEPSATEMMQKEMTGLKTENAALKDQVSKLEQDNRTATAHAAELETQLAELKDRLIATPPPPPPKAMISDAHSAYDHGLQLFRSRNYTEAASTFQGILDGGALMVTELEDNCHYWLGECSFGAKKYSDAIEHFQKVFSFTKSEKKDDAQIMIANSYFALGNKTKAKVEYQKLLDKYPASPYVKKARGRLSQM